MNEFECMLAKTVSEKINWNEPHFIQPKLDGVRCYTKLVDGEVRMYSRNHNEFHNCEHIKTELKQLFNDNPNITLDGELYNHSLRDNFNKIISLVRKSKPTQADKFQASSLIQYHVYDMVEASKEDRDFIDRTLWLTANIQGFRSIRSVETELVMDKKWMDIKHKENKNNGYEGSILRTNGKYEQKRSWNLQKVKDWSDTEFVITGFVEGKGKFSKGIGKFLGITSEGLEVQVPAPSFTINARRSAYHLFKVAYLHEVATFEYFERTPGGAYRFPRFKALRNYE